MFGSRDCMKLRRNRFKISIFCEFVFSLKELSLGFGLKEYFCRTNRAFFVDEVILVNGL